MISSNKRRIVKGDEDEGMQVNQLDGIDQQSRSFRENHFKWRRH